MNKKTLLSISLIGILLVTGLFHFADNEVDEVDKNKGENNVPAGFAIVDSPEYGIAFNYRTQGSDGYTIVTPSENDLDRNQIFLRTLFLATDYEEFLKSPVAREGPTAITIEVYRNKTSRPVEEWIETDPQSNHQLMIGTTSRMRYGEEEYLTYRWDGLYTADTYITEKNGYIYVFTVTYLDSESDMRDDMKQIITSVTFKEPTLPAQTAHNNIKVSDPKPYKIVESPIAINGEARGFWFFEASFPITLTDWDGRIIAEHYIMATNDWMTEDFVPFQGELTFKSPYKSGDPDFMRRGTLILQKDNPSGLPENDDAIEIPILFK